jgi:hypothetical protein
MTLSRELRAAVGISWPVVQTAAQSVLSERVLPNIYPSYLVLIHQIIRASVPIMEAALTQVQNNQQNGVRDGKKFTEYLKVHIAEESRHDEWLLEDLECIGYERGRVLAAEPPAEVARLVGSQYYQIYHDDPLGILGYIAVLEGRPPSIAMIDRMCVASGLPDEAFRTLRIHADVDLSHSEELDRFMDGLTISLRSRSRILANALDTVLSYANCLYSLNSRHQPAQFGDSVAASSVAVL